MSEEKTITEQEAHTNPVLALPVQPDSELKELLTTPTIKGSLNTVKTTDTLIYRLYEII